MTARMWGRMRELESAIPLAPVKDLSLACE
jgi:hypothetical protein